MRVLLAGPDFEENLSVRYLASSLQANGHERLLSVFNSAEDVEAVAEQACDADIIGLSVWASSVRLHSSSSAWDLPSIGAYVRTIILNGLRRSLQ